MYERLRQTIQKHRLIQAGDYVVIGVSGGADSLALLHLLKRLSTPMNFTIHAATLDHQIRGVESAADADFVEAICAEWGIPVTRGSADVPHLADKHHLSLEAAARLARYNFLASVAQQNEARRIAVAHQANDQAETVLLHVLRGTGIHGLRGMGWQSPLPGYAHLTLIRPMLQITRAEVETYCTENDLTPRQDSSNEDMDMTRNYLRLNIIPELEKINPHVQKALTQLGDVAAVEDDYLNEQVEALFQESWVQRQEGSIVIQRTRFGELHPALQRRFIVQAVTQLVGAEHVDYAHVRNAMRIGLSGQVGAVSEFEGGLQLRVDYDTLVLELRTISLSDVEFPLLSPNVEMTLAVPSVIELGHWKIHTSLSPSNADSECRLAIEDGSILTLRTRWEGESFAPLGMNGQHQKLNRWMINRKIPRAARDELPLVCVDGQVAAIFVKGKWTIDSSFAVLRESKRIVYIRFVNQL